ncbi:MAG TPA: adenylate kinase [Candidatus Woesearchaeota archaeon]|nr:adenylate kinase [Candidatus Woesearchaeota archaeon]
MIIVFFGPPGSGKGTIASIVKKELGIPHISTGDLLREEVKKGTELGIKAKSYMDRGELVPDDLVLEVLKRRIEKPDCKNGFILDGYPRNVEQAKTLDRMFKIDYIFNFVLSEEEIIKRLSNRRVCPKCGAIYNLISMPPKTPGICDKCGAALIQRDDDKPQAIRERLEVYKKQTEPVLEYYGDRVINISTEDGFTASKRASEQILKIIRGEI